MEYIDQEFKNIAKLLKQLKKYANHLRDVEWEGSYASGIEFAVKVSSLLAIDAEPPPAVNVHPELLANEGVYVAEAGAVLLP